MLDKNRYKPSSDASSAHNGNHAVLEFIALEGFGSESTKPRDEALRVANELLWTDAGTLALRELTQACKKEGIDLRVALWEAVMSNPTPGQGDPPAKLPGVESNPTDVERRMRVSAELHRIAENPRAERVMARHWRTFASIERHLWHATYLVQQGLIGI
jgi:hypothetical protein